MHPITVSEKIFVLRVFIFNTTHTDFLIFFSTSLNTLAEKEMPLFLQSLKSGIFTGCTGTFFLVSLIIELLKIGTRLQKNGKCNLCYHIL